MIGVDASILFHNFCIILKKASMRRFRQIYFLNSVNDTPTYIPVGCPFILLCTRANTHCYVSFTFSNPLDSKPSTTDPTMPRFAHFFFVIAITVVVLHPDITNALDLWPPPSLFKLPFSSCSSSDQQNAIHKNRHSRKNQQTAILCQLIPRPFFFIRGFGETNEGSGTDPYETGAHDLAMEDAGIHMFNLTTNTLMCLSTEWQHTP